MRPRRDLTDAAMPRPLFGVSTSILQDKLAFDNLLAFDPDVIEFYNYSAAALDTIGGFCRLHRIRPALHVPTPYDGPPLRRFCPSGPDHAEFERALALTIGTVEAAQALEAVHVVVHFPTPYAPHSPIDEAMADRFLAPLADIAQRLSVSVLVENITEQPYFCQPEHYRDALERYDNLGFCLDVGHAHLLSPDAITRFCATLGGRIRSAHLYNLTRARYREYGHEPLSLSADPGEGWIDLVAAANLLKASDVEVLIYECGAGSFPNLSAVADEWKGFRDRLLGDICTHG